jgi:hypothetical protein
MPLNSKIKLPAQLIIFVDLDVAKKCLPFEKLPMRDVCKGEKGACSAIIAGDIGN